MELFDEEIENVAKSIEKELQKQYQIQSFFIIALIAGVALLFYSAVKYPAQTTMPTLNLMLLFILIPIPYIGLSYMDNKSIEKRVFKNTAEIFFYYTYMSWKHRNDNGKKYLKNIVKKTSTYMESYKDLPYADEIYSALDELKDVLVHNIYPELGVRKHISKQDELMKQKLSWDEFKNLAIYFYKNDSIQVIKNQTDSVKNVFERHENVKIYNDKKISKFTKGFVLWNIDSYKKSIGYRFVFFLSITLIFDYFLILQNFDNDVILAATILIPITAPHYLAPNQ